MKYVIIISIALLTGTHGATITDIANGKVDPDRMLLIFNKGIGKNYSLDILANEPKIFCNSIGKLGQFELGKIDLTALKQDIIKLTFHTDCKGEPNDLIKKMDGFMIQVSYGIGNGTFLYTTMYDVEINNELRQLVDKVLESFPVARNELIEAR